MSDYRPRQPGYALAGPTYTTWPVPSGHRLAGLLSEIFYLEQLPEHAEAQVVPDGCDDLLLLFDGHGVRGYFSPSLRERRRFCFSGNGYLLGVRFQPGAAANVIGEPRCFSACGPIEGEDLWQDFAQVKEQLAETRTLGQKTALLTTYLQGKARSDTDRQRLVKFCVSYILETQGTCSVEALARRTGYTDRYLRQCFRDSLGHGPKEFAEIVRVQRLLQLLEEQPWLPLGETALRCGFADQSHMNRAARRYLGHPAGQPRSQTAWSGAGLAERRFG